MLQLKSKWIRINRYIYDHFGHNTINAASYQKYLTNTVWLFSEKSLRLILGVSIGIWIARYLGPADFGLLNYALSFVGLFTAIATLGLDNVLVRELTLAPEKENTLLGTAFALKLISCVIGTMLVALSCFLVNDSADTIILTLVFSIMLLLHPFYVFELFFRAIIRSKFIAYAVIPSLLLGAALRIYLILSEHQVVYFAMVSSIELFASSILLAWFYRWCKRNFLRWRFDRDTAMRLLKDSWPLLVSGTMTSIYMRIDQVMIHQMIGQEAVGYYAAAVRISEGWYYLPMVICQSVLPSIVNTRSRDVMLYDKRIQRLFDLMVVIALFIALPASILAPFFLPLLYGSTYTPAILVFQIHIWAGLFLALGLAGSNWLLAENLQKLIMFNVIAGAVLNILLNVLLIRFFSIYGAACATVASYAFSSYLGLLFFSRTRPCFYKMTRSLLIYRLLYRS